jgi:hypothetical protein
MHYNYHCASLLLYVVICYLLLMFVVHIQKLKTNHVSTIRRHIVVVVIIVGVAVDKIVSRMD